MLDDATRHHLLKLLTEHPESAQRELAAAMGIRLGKANYCINAFNLGNGKGFSVQEIIVTGQSIPAQTEERRPDDPAVLVANSQKARDALNWDPRFADLAAIIGHAWDWEQQKRRAWSARRRHLMCVIQ